MYEEGFYWVKVAEFMEWTIGYFNGDKWNLINDENDYDNIDFNVIYPNKIEQP